MSSLQATYISWVNQLQANITRMRSAEAASAASNSNSGLGAVAAAPVDMPFSQLFSDWVAANQPTWQPQQIPVANALMTINVQVSSCILLSASHCSFHTVTNSINSVQSGSQVMRWWRCHTVNHTGVMPHGTVAKWQVVALAAEAAWSFSRQLLAALAAAPFFTQLGSLPKG